MRIISARAMALATMLVVAGALRQPVAYLVVAMWYANKRRALR